MQRLRRGRRARRKTTPNAPKTESESREGSFARASDCYDIIERGGARRESSVDEADGAGPGAPR
jgi:hypothetical protein